MSRRELKRVEVLARVRGKHLRVVDAGRLLRVSYRQATLRVHLLPGLVDRLTQDNST